MAAGVLALERVAEYVRELSHVRLRDWMLVFGVGCWMFKFFPTHPALAAMADLIAFLLPTLVSTTSLSMKLHCAARKAALSWPESSVFPPRT